MRLRTWIALLVVFSLLQISCGSVGPVATMTGEMATVRLHDKTRKSVELLAVEDSSILCFFASDDESPEGGRVEEIPVRSISSIEVSGFRNDNWVVGVVLFQVLPAVGLTAAAASADADAGAILAISLIPAALTTIAFAASGVPTPRFEAPISDTELSELRKYARFGGKLSSVQKAEMLGVQGMKGSP